MDLLVKELKLARIHPGCINREVKVKRLEVNVERMLRLQEKEMFGEERRTRLATEYFKIWRRGRFPDELTLIKEKLSEELACLCDDETARSRDDCTTVINFLRSIRNSSK